MTCWCKYRVTLGNCRIMHVRVTLKIDENTRYRSHILSVNEIKVRTLHIRYKDILNTQYVKVYCTTHDVSELQLKVKMTWLYSCYNCCRIVFLEAHHRHAFTIECEAYNLNFKHNYFLLMFKCCLCLSRLCIYVHCYLSSGCETFVFDVMLVRWISDKAHKWSLTNLEWTLELIKTVTVKVK